METRDLQIFCMIKHDGKTLMAFDILNEEDTVEALIASLRRMVKVKP